MCLSMFRHILSSRKRMKTVLKVSHLRKAFGHREILSDVSFSLEEGEIVGFVGRNGAGKSTTMKCVVGLLQPQGGTIEVDGKNIVTQREAALRRIAAQIEDPALFETMSGRDNLRLFAALNHVEKSRIANMEAFSGLQGALKRRVETYSMGMKQRLALAIVLLKKPRVLLLDDPMNGLDAQGVQALRAELKALARKEKMAILVSSHQLAEIEKMCDRIVGLKEGRIYDLPLEGNTTSYVMRTDRPIANPEGLTTLESGTYRFDLDGGNLTDRLAAIERTHRVRVVGIEPSRHDLEAVYNEFQESGYDV